jgi:hypothetical protein
VKKSTDSFVSCPWKKGVSMGPGLTFIGILATRVDHLLKHILPGTYATTLTVMPRDPASCAAALEKSSKGALLPA